MSMFNISHLNGVSRKAFLYFIEVVVVAVSLSFLTMVYRTYGDIPAPIVLHEPAIVTVSNAKNQSGVLVGNELMITREVTYNNNEPTTISTVLINKSDNSIVNLQDIKIAADEIGRFENHRVYFVRHLRHGEWCLKSYVFWTPFLSLRERSAASNESCFSVE